MQKCSYCGKEHSEFRGLTLALNSGHVLHYCCSKCRKNAELGRQSKDRKWSKHKTEVAEEKSSEEKEEKVE